MKQAAQLKKCGKKWFFGDIPESHLLRVRNSKSRSYNGTSQNLDLFHSLVHAVNNKFHAVLEFELIEGGHARICNSDTGRRGLPWHTKMTVNTLLTTSFQRPA